MSSASAMPVQVGVQFAHAAVQAIAVSVGVDVLHIKGPAVAPSLLAAVPYSGDPNEAPLETLPRQSLDADVLVRPSQVQRLMDAMAQHGWVLKVGFPDGSAFEHAATMGHDLLAHVDVHRRFPGFAADPEHVFQRLWQDLQTQDIAGVPCIVPHPTAQRLLLILNAVRGGPGRHEEIDRLWNRAPLGEREAVQQLAVELGAEVALAAAAGNLDHYAGSREFGLWQMLSRGDRSPVALWLARVRAQPNVRAALREAIKLIVPNPRRLAVQLGRPLTRKEIVAAWVVRLGDGMRALGAVIRAVGRRKR